MSDPPRVHSHRKVVPSSPSGAPAGHLHYLFLPPPICPTSPVPLAVVFVPWRRCSAPDAQQPLQSLHASACLAVPRGRRRALALGRRLGRRLGQRRRRCRARTVRRRRCACIISPFLLLFTPPLPFPLWILCRGDDAQHPLHIAARLLAPLAGVAALALSGGVSVGCARAVGWRRHRTRALVTPPHSRARAVTALALSCGRHRRAALEDSAGVPALRGGSNKGAVARQAGRRHSWRARRRGAHAMAGTEASAEIGAASSVLVLVVLAAAGWSEAPATRQRGSGRRVGARRRRLSARGAAPPPR